MQLEQIGADTARRLAMVGRLMARRAKADADLVDSLRRILESPTPQAKRLQQLIKGIANGSSASDDF
jgi:hypothetical protein